MKCRIIKETDADYQAICDSVTHISRIRKHGYMEPVRIYADVAGEVAGRRHEDASAMRTK